MNKNDIIKCTIESMSYGGSAVTHINGMAVFVRDGVPGDISEIRILKLCKNYAYAKTEKILTPSPDRKVSSCNISSKCGCCFSDFSYETELKYKYGFVADSFKHIGGLENIKINDVIPSPVIFNYRNKVQYPVGKDKNGKTIIGFYRQHSHSIVDIEKCCLQHNSFDDIIPVFREWIDKYGISIYDEATGKGALRHICARTVPQTGQIVITLVMNSEKITHSDELCAVIHEKLPNVVGLVLNINKKPGNEILGDECRLIFGTDKLTEKIGDLQFTVSPYSFFQINSYQTERLYSVALDAVKPKPTDVLLDLCSGVGTITQYFAPHVKEAIGIEIVPDAVDDANKSAVINGLNNCRFICGDVTVETQKLLNNGFSPDIVSVDPARKGLDADAIIRICDMKPKKIVYISCNPSTQARDVAIFMKYGYTPKYVQPVDMFPRTYHVENVLLMTK